MRTTPYPGIAVTVDSVDSKDGEEDMLLICGRIVAMFDGAIFSLRRWLAAL